VRRLKEGGFPEGENAEIKEEAAKAREQYIAALENDLNTAEARAPIFDLLRVSNTAIDQGRFFAADRDTVLKVLADFDRVFDVIEDRDEEPTRRAVEWAEQNGQGTKIAPELRARMALTDQEIDALVAERTRAKKMRNFARADAIRNELAEKGVVLEDSKNGVRWKRK
jgi:cysteinyl-tRNA synthetase